MHSLALAELVFAFFRFDDELLAALGILEVGERHPPVRHCVLRFESRHLPKAALRLEIPEAVVLAEPLVEKLLHFRAAGSDREADLAGSTHQVRCLSRAFIEDLAMSRVAGSAVGLRLVL